MKKLFGIISSIIYLAVTSTSIAAIYIQPYLQNPRTDGITIVWWTDTDEPSNSVLYGTDTLNNTVAASNEYVSTMAKWRHLASVSGLTIETQYQYRVTSSSSQSNIYTFSTAKRADSDMHFAVLGDGRTDNDTVIARHRGMGNTAITNGADIIFEAGDMVLDGSIEHWTNFFRKVVTPSDPTNPGGEIASRIPYQMAVGNHEIYTVANNYTGGNLTTSMLRFKAFSSTPANGSANSNWEGRYYAIKYGCVTFIVLDTNNDSVIDNHDLLANGTTPDWSAGSEQYNWMVTQLQQAQSDSVFTFVLMHPAPYSRGVHGAPTSATDSQRGYQVRALEPIFRQYGVDAVFASHDHFVEHCLTGPSGFQTAMNVADPNNLNWFVQGNSGHSSRTAQSGWESWMDITGNNAAPFYTVYFYSWGNSSGANDYLCSYLDADITYQGQGVWQAVFKTIRSDGQIFDTTTIQRQDTQYAAACGDRDHTPPVGDLNNDCHVNLYDAAIMAGFWNETDCVTGGCGGSDLMPDSNINLMDLAELTENWLSCTSPLSPCGYLP